MKATLVAASPVNITLEEEEEKKSYIIEGGRQKTFNNPLTCVIQRGYKLAREAQRLHSVETLETEPRLDSVVLATVPSPCLSLCHTFKFLCPTLVQRACALTIISSCFKKKSEGGVLV